MKNNLFYRLGCFFLDAFALVYYLIYGDDREKIYLIPGGTLNISFDAQNIPKSINFLGEGEIESTYLVDKDTNDYNAVLLRIYLLEEEGFLKTSDSIKRANLSRLASYEAKLNRDFFRWAQGEIKYLNLFNILRYPGLRKFKTGNKDFKVSENYPKVLDGLSLNEDELSDITYYSHLVTRYVFDKVKKEKLVNDSTDKKYLYLVKFDEEIENSSVKSQVAYWEGLNNMTITTVPELYMEKLRNLITDSIQLNYLENRYRKVILTKKGKTSPKFSFINQDEKLVALDDLKGKLVYIDVWATWCLPCLKEIPHLDTLQKDYSNKNIVFVSIAWEDNRERWEKVIKEKEMGGIQLFSKNKDADFFIDYTISGVPRFILLDQNLDIIDASAKRPSDQSLRQQLDELLEQ